MLFSARTQELGPEAPPATPGPSRARAITCAVALLEERLDERLNLRQLARECGGLSPAYFLRRFTRATGLTPGRFLMRLRVEKAVTLLREGMTSAQVAAEVGFYDQSHLNRVFRRLLGVTPGAYARRHRVCD